VNNEWSEHQAHFHQEEWTMTFHRDRTISMVGDPSPQLIIPKVIAIAPPFEDVNPMDSPQRLRVQFGRPPPHRPSQCARTCAVKHTKQVGYNTA
jgi:hypothetical protein